MAATTALPFDMSAQGFSEETANAVTMAMTAGQLLPEIYESVLLVRDIILKDQLPHFRAAPKVKEQLQNPQTIERGDHALDVLNRVQERLLQQIPPVLDPIPQNQNILPPASTLSRISFPNGAAFNEWQRDGTDVLQERQRKPLRHLRFESKSQDGATTNIAPADLELMTGDLMKFSKRDASPLNVADFVHEQTDRVIEDAESVFDENDYYSSQVDSSVGSSPRLARSRKELEILSFADEPAVSDDRLASQRLWGQMQPPDLTGGPGIPSEVDMWANSPDISEDSEDYTPPAAHVEYSDDDGEYDPMQLEPGMYTTFCLGIAFAEPGLESDYDPNDLEDHAPTIANKTPVVTSRLTQIAAPQPSRVSTHTVSKMSTMANTGTARSPAGIAGSAIGMSASTPSIEPYDPSYSNAMFLQQQPHPSQGMTQSKHHGQHNTVQQSVPRAAEAFGHNQGKRSNKGGKAREPPAVHGNDSSQIGRTRQDRSKKAEDRISRRDRKMQRRQAKAERERHPTLSEHSTREVQPPPQSMHMPAYTNPHGAHQAPVGAYEGMLPPPSHLPERSFSRAVGHTYMLPPPGRPATTVQMLPYGSHAPGHNIAYPHPASAVYAQPLLAAPSLHPVSGRASVVPVDQSYQQPPQARLLAPGETTLVRDQHGNIYFARPVAATPQPAYPPQAVTANPQPSYLPQAMTATPQPAYQPQPVYRYPPY